MGRANLDRTKIHELEKEREHHRKKKSEFLDIFRKNKDKKQKHDKKPITHWINHHEKNEFEINEKIHYEEKRVVHNYHSNHKSFILFLVLSVFAFSVLFYYLSPHLTGFTIGERTNEQSYTDDLSVSFADSGEYSWTPQNQGKISSASISGYIEIDENKNGNGKVFLDDLLIFDSEKQSSDIQKEQKTRSLLTGLAISDSGSEDGATTGDSSVSDSSSDSAPAQESDQNLLDSQLEDSLSPEKESNIQEGAPQTGTSPSQEEPLVENPIKDERENGGSATPDEENITESLGGNQTLNKEENQTTGKVRRYFSLSCVDTCDIRDILLNKSKYNLRVELSNSFIYIDKITYSIIQTENKENEIVINQTALNETAANISLENQSDFQYPAEINKPIKWKRYVKVENVGVFSTELPEEAQNIEIQKKGEIENNKLKYKERKDNKKNNVEFDNEQENSEYDLFYETPAPKATVTSDGKSRKTIIVSGPDSVHYHDVLTYANLSDMINVSDAKWINLYWLNNGTREKYSFNASDTNGDGILDKVEWVTPHLSNETFEIILITKAEHLDKDKTFINDIYDSVKELDGNWSEPIQNKEYIRVTFEKNLTKENDITIFPRIASGNPIVNVYEVDKNESIAVFGKINPNQYNKIFLTNLTNEQGTFDLQVKGGSIELDHIIDPTITSFDVNRSGRVLDEGEVAELTYTFETETAISDSCASNITYLDARNCTHGGDANSDSYFLWNVTLPDYDALYNVTLFARAAQTGTNDRLNLSVYNFTLGAWMGRNGSAPTANVKNNLTFIIDGSNIGSFVSGKLVRFMLGTTGSATSNLILDFMNVTFTYDTDTIKPVVNLQAPANGTTITTSSVSFNATFSDNNTLNLGGLMVWNSSGDLINTANVTINGTRNSINVTYVLPYQGAFRWNYRANDSSNNLGMNSTNFTLIYNLSIGNCGILSSSNTVYVQGANITPNVTACINITATNVTFDGAGYSFTNTTYNGTIFYSDQLGTTIRNSIVNISSAGSNNYGIYFLSANNSYVSNFTSLSSKSGIYINTTKNVSVVNGSFGNIPTNVYGIYSELSYNLTIEANMFTASNGSGIGLVMGSLYSSSVIIKNNNFSSLNKGVSMGLGDSITVIGNNFLSCTTGIGSDSGGGGSTNHLISGNVFSLSGTAIGMYTVDSLVVRDNIISHSTVKAIGSSIATSYGNQFINNTLNNNSIGFEIGGNNILKDIIINASRSDAIRTANKNNTFNNVNVTNTINGSSYDFNTLTGDTNGTIFIDSYIGNYTLNKVGTLIFNSSRYGQIKFVNPVNGTGTNLSADIVIGNNSVFVNTTANGGFNATANVTLSGIPTNFITPAIFRDGVVCTNCYNFTSLNAGTVLFNVSSWSNYTIASNIVDVTPPVVNLIAPGNGTTVTTSSVSFNATFSDDTVLKNTTLYIWNSTGDLINRTVNTTLSGTTGSANLSVILPYAGTFLWNYLAFDTSGNSSFNRTNFTLTYDPNLISSCVNLTSPNSVYNQIADIVPTIIPCINITATNVTFNGGGYSFINITYNGTLIYSDQLGTTVKNSVINISGVDSSGVYLIGANNSIINNITILRAVAGVYLNLTNNISLYNSTFKALNISGTQRFGLKTKHIGNNLIVRGNTFTSVGIGSTDTNNPDTGAAIGATAEATNIVFINNSFSSFYSTASDRCINPSFPSIFDGFGAYDNNFIGCATAIGNNGFVSVIYNHTYIRNTFSNSGVAITQYVRGGRFFKDNVITNSSTSGVGLGYSETVINNTFNNNSLSIEIAAGANTLINVTINGSRRDAIRLSDMNNTLVNVIIINTNSSVYDLNATGNINNTFFMDNYIGKYTIPSSGYLIFNSSLYGQIRFLSSVNGTGANLSRDISIGNNSVFVNSSVAGLNVSANVTLTGISTTFTNPKILKDGVQCTDCYNFTSLNAGTVVFNVSSWSNYSIGELASNSAPQIISVDSLSAQSITEDSVTSVLVNFTVYDSNGFLDINNNSGIINFTRSGEGLRQNTSCINVSSYSSNYANFSCTVQIWYFDAAGTWTVGVKINDTSNAQGFNTTTSFTLQETTAFVSNPSSLAWNSLSPGSTNQTPTNTPLLLNNTGNANITFGNVSVNSTNLKGEVDNSKAIYANNFSVGVATGSSVECGLGTNQTTVMTRASFVTLANASLIRGNHSINDGVTGQEQLYPCIRLVGSELSGQAYSTSADGAWTIKVLLVVFSAGKSLRKLRNKKKIKGNLNEICDDRLTKAVTLLLSEIKEKRSLDTERAVELVIDELKEKYDLNKEEINSVINMKESQKIFFPLSIFSNKLGALEALSKYLKENKKMRYSEIGRLLNRDQRTIWTAYSKANGKRKDSFEMRDSDYLVDLLEIVNKNLTILESIVLYLKENKKIRYSEIGRLLNRDQRNIRIIYFRALKK